MLVHTVRTDAQLNYRQSNIFYQNLQRFARLAALEVTLAIIDTVTTLHSR